MKWKNYGIVIILTLLTLVAAACSGNQQKSGQEEEVMANQQKEESSQQQGKTEVIFWHAMGGNLQTTLEEIVADFNAEHDDIVVKPQYQGSYDETLTKFRSVGGTKDAPTIIQVYEIGTKYMIESGFIEPMQTFIDRDGYDLSQLEENIISYYTVDGKMYSMPFNSSTPVLIYNKDAFEDAGLDPEDPPRTFSEIQEAARKLTVKNGENTERYGFSMLNHGWFFEQLVYTQGGHYVNQDNGAPEIRPKRRSTGKKDCASFNF